ncbi:MAG: hypothetical protein AAF502_25190 [Bacteroidota bacterium]
MKKLLFFLAILLTYTTCKENEVQTRLENDIIGVWKAWGVYCGDDLNDTIDYVRLQFTPDEVIGISGDGVINPIIRDTYPYMIKGDILTTFYGNEVLVEGKSRLEMPNVDTLHIYNVESTTSCLNFNARYDREQ